LKKLQDNPQMHNQLFDDAMNAEWEKENVKALDKFVDSALDELLEDKKDEDVNLQMNESNWPESI
jgi:hypothetical protein